ncbi:TetR family transcriptional regulator [Rhizobium anhuiense]|uniref:TetR family transcriptional regulator n=1 Tax=Rhizobium anhuiense TaxID=1184720 RepID=A0ABX4J3A2_9HYPH|nr:TetR/AcrR family transcriptional regulator [Rhizobium anhuiense]PDS41200.1 TetR family transcriptional regulator [Rhizobium anhuiense]PDS49660.1 TetR family transcriptional regulator [Rhizobium anhuiense]
MAVGTRDALVQTAESLMRTKGYAAFSYADLAETVGIRKASIHHHFPTKEDLGTAIVKEYIDRVRDDFAQIERQHEGAIARLEAFFKIFRASTDGGLLPLCGALAAEMSALPLGLQQLTHRFFEMQLKWLEAVLEQGMERGEYPSGPGARQKAFALLSLLEGSSFINWATKAGDPMDDRIVRLIVEES